MTGSKATRCGALFACLCLAFVWAQTGPSIYEQAAAFIQGGQPANAVALMERRLQESPEDLRAQTLMGMALSADGRREQANRYFLQALKVNPGYAPALRNLAINEMALGQSAGARTHFEQVLKLTPSDALAHLALAQLDFVAKNYRSAAVHYRQSGDLYLRDPPNALNFARALVVLKETARAVEVLEHLPKEADSATHFGAGTLLASLGKYAAAAREFERAQPGASNAYEVGFNLMLACDKAGDSVAAARVGEELLAQGHGKPELYNLLAQALEKAGRTKEAYDALRTATNIDPADPANYVDLIALCIGHKNYDLALEIAGIGVARLPASERLHLQRGIVLAMQEKFDAAKDAFETAVKVGPQKTLPYVALGLILMQMDRPAEAVSVLRKRARAGGGDYIVLWFLGEALSRSSAEPGTVEEKEAVDALSRSVSLKPDVAQPRVVLAKLLARRGQLDLAVKHLERALELDPGNVSATYQLAQVCQRKGDAARAKQLFAKVSNAKAEEREQFTRGGLLRIIREGSR